MIYIGKELCFWCVETHQPCQIHATNFGEVYREEPAIRAFSSHDRFEIVEESQLVNLSTFVRYSDGEYWMSPTCSTSHVPYLKPHQNFTFESEVSQSLSPSATSPKSPKKVKSAKEVKEVKLLPNRNRDRQTKLHVNTLKTAPKKTQRGRKVDLARKQFVCDICEVSFTLRQNVQQHLVNFHGDRVGVTQEMVAGAEKLRYFQWRQMKDEDLSKGAASSTDRVA